LLEPFPKSLPAKVQENFGFIKHAKRKGSELRMSENPTYFAPG
jgi:hypothetical protein